MQKEFKPQLIDVVTKAVDGDALSDDDALEIIGICQRAMDREIARLTELYMINAVGGEAQ